MASTEKGLEEKLVEAGNELLNLPSSSTEELIKLLDNLEHLLANVSQAPPRTMQEALFPVLKSLISDQLLKHENADVKISVTSCITEITRITAPNSPYNDDLMKKILELTVEAFEKLLESSGRCYSKAIMIIDAVSRVKSFLMMLDLECNGLILEMFRNFLRVIRSNHPGAVFIAMEAIMTIVINESEEISSDLLSPLLASVAMENQNVSPISWKLGAKVITNCAAKLKPYIIKEVKSKGFILDDYAPIISSIFQSGSDNRIEHLQVNGAEKQLADEKEMLKKTESNDPSLPTEKPKSGASLKEATTDDDTSKSVMTTGKAMSKKDVPIENDGSSRKVHNCHPRKHRCNQTVFAGRTVLRNIDCLATESAPESVPKRRGRKPKSLKIPQNRFDHTNASPSSEKNPILKKILPSSDFGSLPKRGQKKASDSDHVEEKSKEPEDSSKMREKDCKTVSPVDPDEKPMEKLVMKIKVENTNEVISLAENDISELSGKKKRNAKSAAKSSEKGTDRSGTTPKSGIKRKSKTVKKEDAETSDLGEEMVGKRIKVWWPLDKMFYAGVIDSYDRLKNRHKVVYLDGEVENLILKKQRYKLIGDDDVALDGSKETDVPEPDATSDSPQLRKRKAKPTSVERSNPGSPSKRFRSLTKKPKFKTRDQFRGKSVDDSIVEEKLSVVDETMNVDEDCTDSLEDEKAKAEVDSNPIKAATTVSSKGLL